MGESLIKQCSLKQCNIRVGGGRNDCHMWHFDIYGAFNETEKLKWHHWESVDTTGLNNPH